MIATLALPLAGCSKDDDAVVYAAEFVPDEDGKVKKGEPQYLLTAVVEEQGGQWVMYQPAPTEEPDGYSPGQSDKIMAGDLNNGAGSKSKRLYMTSLSDQSFAHLNPYRTYSPYRTASGKYVPTKPGLKYDVKAKKYYRVVPKELPCWRCGATKQYSLLGETFDCEECDENGFTEYHGRQHLKVGEGNRLTPIAPQKVKE